MSCLLLARLTELLSRCGRTNREREMISNLFYTVYKCDECERLRNKKKKLTVISAASILYISFLFYFANYFISISTRNTEEEEVYPTWIEQSRERFSVMNELFKNHEKPLNEKG